MVTNGTVSFESVVIPSVRTLLHEVCHHLDYELYKLEETFHTEGFYKRESSLVVALLAQREAADERALRP